jgi:hypothetical protein
MFSLLTMKMWLTYLRKTNVVCKYCGLEFHSEHHLQKYCSSVCRYQGDLVSKTNWRNNNLKLARLCQENYRQQNKAYYAEQQRKRVLHIKQANPNWADSEKIKQIYKEAQEKGLEVDHIIPLRGKNVSGLHVENNLQLITKQENCRKTNNYVD